MAVLSAMPLPSAIAYYKLTAKLDYGVMGAVHCATDKR